MNEQQQLLHQSTPSVIGYVEPRIQEIERRIQLRTPEPKSSGIGHQPRSGSATGSAPSNRNDNDGNNPTTPSDKNTTNHHALVLHSPILSSLLPNSTIKQFESDVLKKQAQYSARISDLEGRLALFHTRLATECAERGREHEFTMEEYVVSPLEQAAKRCLGGIETEFVRPIMDPKRATTILCGNNLKDCLTEGDCGEEKSLGENEGETGTNEMEKADPDGSNDNTSTDNNPLPNLVAIERRTNLLEAQMNHHKHVTLFHSRRAHFDDVEKTCRQTVQPELALEMTKVDKREGGMVRRFESSAGEYTHLVSEMTSSRVSSLGYIEKEIDGWDISDLTRAEHYLEEIQKLKQRVAEERKERVRQDEQVVQKIVQTKKILEEDIFLACYPGGV